MDRNELPKGEDVIYCDNRYYHTWNGAIIKKGQAERDTRILRRYEDGLMSFEQCAREMEVVHEVQLDRDKLKEWLRSLGWQLR